MKFPISWLRDYISIDCDVDELANKLTMAGLEVDDISYLGKHIAGITTGRIDSITKHPDADKLVITSIFDGKNHHQIVTGAANISEGDIVPVSLPGAILANEMTIKSTKLRGVQSDGMLCSETECGVADESNGIWILPTDTPLGIDFVNYATLKDAVLDISILPNRGDCQSILGLAREIAAITGQSFQLPAIELIEMDIKHSYSVTSNTDLCPLYMGRYISNLTNGKSPIWLERRLQLCGIRPISAIVDITNYVLLETGHPLHAFDDHLCAKKSFTIEEASSETTITTLDEQTRTLDAKQLVIMQANQPVAIAGIMGGKDTEVSDSTTCIFLEAAYFDSTSVRRSATALGLRTESSIRFEKGVPIDTVDYASRRAASLLTELANGSVSKHVITAKNDTHSCFKQQKISFSLDQLNMFLGSHFTQKQVETVLYPLGFTFQKDTLTIPSWRCHDIKEWPCIAEEVARLLGFDAIQSSLPHSLPIQDYDDPIVDLIRNTQDFFVTNGFNEVTSYPMISEDDLCVMDLGVKESWNELANPISPQLAIMRPSLLPSLLPLIAYHTTRQLPNQALFEVGRTFHKDYETTSLGIALSGKRDLSAYQSSARDLETDTFHYLTHTCKRFFDSLGLSISLKQETEKPMQWQHPYLNYRIYLNKTVIGSLAHIHPNTLDHYSIKEPVIYLDINLNHVLANLNKPKTYHAFSRFPSIRRDIAVCVPDTLSFADIMEVITKYQHKSVIKTGVFDLFESQTLAPYQRSIGIYFIYQSMTETLSDDNVNANHQRLCDRLTESLPIQIR